MKAFRAIFIMQCCEDSTDEARHWERLLAESEALGARSEAVARYAKSARTQSRWWNNQLFKWQVKGRLSKDKRKRLKKLALAKQLNRGDIDKSRIVLTSGASISYGPWAEVTALEGIFLEIGKNFSKPQTLDEHG